MGSGLFTVLVVPILAMLFAGAGRAQEQEVRVSGREFLEKLTRVEEGQRQLGERLTRVEEGQRSLEQRMIEGFTALGQRINDTNQRIDNVQATVGQRIDDTNRRIDELRQFLLWGFGVTIAGMFAMVGFVIWDRRSALAPAVRRIEELREREERVEAALREYATKSPELAESLRKMGLL